MWAKCKWHRAACRVHWREAWGRSGGKPQYGLRVCDGTGHVRYKETRCLIIKGGGGIRKLRHAIQGRGKSGGVRAIYYWVKDDHQIFMLVVYPKSKKDTLADKEVAILRELVKEL